MAELDQGKIPVDEAMKEIREIPNVISLFRIFLLPLIWLSFLSESTGSLLPFSLILLSGISDYFDGFLAKKLNKRTRLGRVLDPVADKLTFAVLFFLLYEFRELPLWIPVCMVTRDLAIIAFGYSLARKYGIIVTSNEIGRKTTVLMFGALLLYVLQVQPLAQFLLFFGLAGILISTLSYLINYLRIASHAQSPQ